MPLAQRFFATAASFLAAGLALADADRIEVHQPIPSSAMVLIQGAKKDHYIQGSGFLVNRDERLLVTNQHVAQVGKAVVVIFPVYEAGQVLVSRDFYRAKAPRLAGRTVAEDRDRDLALIRLEALARDVPELKLAAKLPKQGESAHLLGNPGKSDQAWVYAKGKVHEVGENRLPGTLGQRVATLVLRTDDRKIGPGASGGPVVNERSELIGVIQSGPEDSREVCCVPVSEVRCFLSEFHRIEGTEAIKKKDFSRAVDRCSKSLKINPYNALAYNERGVALAFQEQLDEAIADYTAAIQLEPKLPRFYRNRAGALYGKDRALQALADLTEAIRLDPNHASSYLFRSKVYAKLDRPLESKADHDKAIKLDPALK